MTVLLTVWAAVGPLLGILVGHYLVRSWERKRWLADNQKEEYRRVLAALNKLNILMIDWTKGSSIEPIKTAMDEVVTSLNTSLFITEFFEKNKVMDDIGEAERFCNERLAAVLMFPKIMEVEHADVEQESSVRGSTKKEGTLYTMPEPSRSAEHQPLRILPAEEPEFNAG